MTDSSAIRVRFLAATPSGPVPLTPEHAATRLPADPQDPKAQTELRYGPYLESLRDLLLRNHGQRLLEAVRSRCSGDICLADIDWIEIRTEKHGASYHVARADVSVSGTVLSFAINVAARQTARSQLERDFRLLKRLGRIYGYQYLPRVYLKSAERYREGGKSKGWLHMFVAEWFRGYHEFHLHQGRPESPYRLLLWDQDRGSRYLTDDQSLGLYDQAAKILTLHYDWNNFCQICPWHHAAGDFVVKEEGGRVDVRLITVRDYTPVVSFKTRKVGGKLLSLVLFFLHLTIQMRLDRLDGVGEVVWADDACLKGIVAGFFEGLLLGDANARKGIPSAQDLSNLFRRFSQEEWLNLLEECLDTYEISEEELSLIHEYGGTHLKGLRQILQGYSPADVSSTTH